MVTEVFQIEQGSDSAAQQKVCLYFFLLWVTDLQVLLQALPSTFHTNRSFGGYLEFVCNVQLEFLKSTHYVVPQPTNPFEVKQNTSQKYPLRHFKEFLQELTSKTEQFPTANTSHINRLYAKCHMNKQVSSYPLVRKSVNSWTECEINGNQLTWLF